MFISFEGTEGVGKTTLIRRIYDDFIAQGKEVVLTREPGGTPMAEQIRSLLLAVNHEEAMCHDVCGTSPASGTSDITRFKCWKNCLM